VSPVPVRVSTIIPTVSRPSLARAVDSALAQDLEGHEVIVVNDSGAALPPAAWMASARVRVLATDRRERSVARNAGAAAAAGRFLHFLDDDDHLLPGGLAALLEAALARGAVWVYGGLQRMDDQGRPLSIDHPTVRGNIMVELVGGDALHPSPSLIGAAEFARAGGFDPGLSMCEDRDLEVRLAMQHDVARCDRVVACVRVGATGASTSDWSRMTRNSRLVRERALDQPGALARLLDSAGGESYRRGRVVRAYALSLLQQAAAGRLAVAARRLAPMVRMAAYHPVHRSFWAGLRTRA